ncbi:MAG: phosphatidate cytidylyltransferase [Puniceicoccales bacterium]|jgi:phosphatidate cytidylyltransferase|nr:phosphatidate cytidylyltransferase [Puniceicoccales bacterium]
MKARICSFFVLWTVVIVMLAVGGTHGAILLMILASLWTQYELCLLCRKAGYEPYRCHCLGYGFLMLMMAWKPPDFMNSIEASVAVFICAMLDTTFYSFLQKEPKKIMEGLVTTICNLVYVPMMFMFPIAMLREWSLRGNGKMAMVCIVWIVAVAKFSDVGGLCIGSLCGGKKLAPLLSPAKTRKGFIGALVFGSLLAGLGGRILFPSFFPENFSAARALLLATLLTLIAVFSDLLESMIKRLAQVKDSGNLIPGIGGIFDLTDSLILTLPVGVFYFHYGAHFF